MSSLQGLMSQDWSDEEATDTAATRFAQQLRSYEREKVACRLKVCCLLQLVRAPLCVRDKRVTSSQRALTPNVCVCVLYSSVASGTPLGHRCALGTALACYAPWQHASPFLHRRAATVVCCGRH